MSRLGWVVIGLGVVVFVTAAAALYLRLQMPQEEATVPPAERSKIAFVSNRDGNGEIYVVNADGSELTRLTDHPGRDWCPVWSPDGQWLAFTRTEDTDGDGMAKVGLDATTIHVMKADGSEEKPLGPFYGADFGLTWSPGGDKLLLGMAEDVQWRGEGYYIGEEVVLYVIDVQEGQITVLTEKAAFFAPAIWWPDGQFVLYRDREGDLYAVPSEGGEATKVAEGMHGFALALSPDGTRIAFSSRAMGKNSQIYIMGIDGGERVPLLQEPTPGFINSLTWSPDGSQLAYMAGSGQENEPFNLYVVDVEGEGVPMNLTQWEIEVYAPPVWSPDERFIAFAGFSEQGPPHIWVVEVESGQLFQLTRGEGADFLPAWR